MDISEKRFTELMNFAKTLSPREKEQIIEENEVQTRILEKSLERRAAMRKRKRELEEIREKAAAEKEEREDREFDETIANSRRIREKLEKTAKEVREQSEKCKKLFEIWKK
jgi:biopolymer transport protein ExbB/TolQ